MTGRLAAASFLAFSMLVGSVEAQPFHVAPVYPAPTNPMYDLATGDLNGDGWPDFVGADLATHLTVFLNDTHGSFSASSIPTPGTRLWSVAIADFTSDSVPDIVAADESGLFLFVGNGSGGFAPAVSVHGGRYQWVASTDLNGDGHADLVTGLTYMGGVTLWSWIGTGTGQFAPPQIVFTSIAFANWPKLTDLNADGKPDLALPGPSGVWVLLADGSGGFGPAVLHLAGGYDTTDIAIGDFNNDVNGDLVAATSQGLYFFPGDGAGDFELTVPSPGVILTGLMAADFNEDGKRDLGGRTSLGEGAVLGDGAGHFTASNAYIDGAGNVPKLAVDVDLDSHQDIVSAQYGISILRGDGTARFDALEAFAIPVQLGTPQLAAGDFNEDGHVDLGVANPFDPSLVLLGDGQGALSPAGSAAGCPNIYVETRVGDIDGDTHLDLVALGRDTQSPTTFAVCVFLGDGAGGLATPVTTPIQWTGFAVADFNEDGRDDVVVARGPADALSVLISAGLGAFAPPVDYLADSDPESVATGDWNGDGHADVASLGVLSHDLSVRLGNGLGGLGSRTLIPVGNIVLGNLVVGDWNGDQKPDLALGSLILLGDGTGLFAPAGSFPADSLGIPWLAADFDVDGHQDITSFQAQDGVVPASMFVSPGDGAGGFGAPWAFHGLPGYGNSVSAVAGDFNEDGRPDIMLGVTGAVWPFLSLAADLTVSIDDGQATAVPGAPITYIVTLTNLGPRSVPGATLAVALPATLLSPTFSPSVGAYNPATGAWTGLSLAAVGSVTLTITGTLDPAGTGDLSVSVSVTAPSGFGDPNAANNAATDVDVLTPQADLGVQLSDLGDPAALGSSVIYLADIGNAGPSKSPSATLTIALPAGATFLSSMPGPPTCTEVSGLVTCSLLDLAPGAAWTASVDASFASPGVETVTAGVVGSVHDPQASNDTTTQATSILAGPMRELVPGSTLVSALESVPGPPSQVYRVRQPPRSSWEVLVDGVTGDIGSGAGPLVEFVDDTAVPHPSVAAGAGSSRSLRLENPGSDAGEGYVRVSSAGCSIDCGPEDVYRIMARQTTLFGARFNNSATQLTVLLVQNTSAEVVTGHVDFWANSGVRLHGEPFSLQPHQTLVLPPSGIPQVQGQAGTLTVSHDGRIGALVGKATAVEPATGFTFDTQLVTRGH